MAAESLSEKASGDTKAGYGPRKRKERNVVFIEKIETEADRQLKELVKKQLEVKPSLDENLKVQKEFTTPSVYAEPRVRGELSFEEFKRRADKNKRIEELRAYQLSPADIMFVLDHEFSQPPEEPPEKKHRLGINPAVKEERLREVYQKIEEKEKLISNTSDFQKLRHLSRHEFEFERTLVSNSKSSNPLNKLILHSAQSDATAKSQQDSDVLCALKQLEDKVAKATTYREKLADSDMELSSESSTLSNQSTGAADGPTDAASPACTQCLQLRNKDRGLVGPLAKDEWQRFEYCDSCRRKQQLQSVNELNAAATAVVDSEVTACAQSLEKNIVLSSSISIPESVIVTYRLSVGEIRQLPRFQEYEPGEPNKTLYLKNLSSKVLDEDLPALFMRYQRQDADKIIYKLLKGRMRGQAFVTFPDTETATQALQLVNGFDFKGKPIIIQYAKKH